MLIVFIRCQTFRILKKHSVQQVSHNPNGENHSPPNIKYTIEAIIIPNQFKSKKFMAIILLFFCQIYAFLDLIAFKTFVCLSFLSLI